MTERLLPGMIVYFDGGCTPNPGKMIACVVICPPTGEPQVHTVDNLGTGTSNIAEWAALILAASLLEDHKGKVTIMGDSRLVVNQVNGLWRLRDQNLIKLADEFYKTVAGRFDYEVLYVPRERNLAGRYLEHGHI